MLEMLALEAPAARLGDASLEVEPRPERTGRRPAEGRGCDMADEAEMVPVVEAAAVAAAFVAATLGPMASPGA